MTHWVIYIDNNTNTLYAGADKLAVGANYQERGFNKIVKVVKDGKSCIICCGDSGDLLSRQLFESRQEDLRCGRPPNPDDKREKITDIIYNLLISEINFADISSANELLLRLSVVLSQNYLTDSRSPILLGCGFANYTNSLNPLTIASYDSNLLVRREANPIVISFSGYLDMDGITERPNFNTEQQGIEDMINAVISNHPMAGDGVDIESISPQPNPQQRIQATRNPATTQSNPNVTRNRILLVFVLALIFFYFEGTHAEELPNSPPLPDLKNNPYNIN